MMHAKDIRRGALIELRDPATRQWRPVAIRSIVFDHVECRTLANEPINTTKKELADNARLRPSDGSCADCGADAHDGPCIDRHCSECGAEVSSRCSQHPSRPVHVYRRDRYLAEIVEDKPYPTREQYDPLRRDIVEQLRTLRNAGEVRQGKVMISCQERAEIMGALKNAANLIGALPTERHKRNPS